MSNEITVKLQCSVKDICDLLKSKEYVVVRKYTLDDTYFIPKELKLEDMSYREILSKAILLRDITEFMPAEKIVKLTFKNKEIDDKGNILKQSKVDCEIKNIEDGKLFLEAIGYNELIKIEENDIGYKKDDLEITVKDIKNGDKLLEIETVEGNTELDTIEKLIDKVNSLDIPIDKSNYFVKKTEIELKKIL